MEKDLSQILGLPESTVANALARLNAGSQGASGKDSGGSSKLFLDQVYKLLISLKDSTDDAESTARLQLENTRLEQEVYRLQKRSTQLKDQLSASHNETKSIRNELEELQKKFSDTTKSQLDHQSQLAGREASETRLQEQITQLKEEKQTLISQLAERRSQIDKQESENRKLTDVIDNLRQQHSSTQEELMRLQSKNSVSDVNEHMLKQSLELTKNQVKWLDEELTNTQTQLQSSRSELAKLSTTNNTEISRLNSEIESLSEQLSDFKDRNASIERTLRAKISNERQIKEDLAEQTEQFKLEMTAQKRLCAEWEKSANAAKEHLRTVEASLEELENHQKESEAKAQDAIDMMEQKCSDLELAYSDAQNRISTLEDELKTANNLIAETSRSSSNLLLSPTASVASKLQQGNSGGHLNITQLYSEKVALEDRLKKADAEIACLRESMEQILTEIEERGPIIAAEREEYQRLLKDADQIAQDLAHVRQDNATKDTALKSLEKDREHLRRQLDAELQQAKDMSRQMARLLRVIEENRIGGRVLADGPGVPKPGSSEQDDGPWMNDVDKVISQKLVTFADIVELLSQNRRLLQITRSLAAKSAKEEEEGNIQNSEEHDDTELQNALDQAEVTLSRLTEELESANMRLGIVERERDMLKSIKSNRSAPGSAIAYSSVQQTASAKESDEDDIPPVTGSGSYTIPAMHSATKSRNSKHFSSENHASDFSRASIGDNPSEALDQLRSEFEIYVTESQKTREDLENDIAKAQKEISELRVRAAKAEAQTEFDAERIQLFTRDLESRQQEINHLRIATSRLHTQSESYESQISSISEELSTERVELSRLRRQLALAEAERNMLRQSEQRWHTEEQRYIEERTSMTQILQNTAKMRDEWKKASDEKVESIKARLETTQRDVESANDETKRVREINERMQFKHESEERELRAQIQSRDERVSELLSQIQKEKDALAALNNEKHSVELARDSLKHQVSVFEARLSSEEDLANRAKAQGMPADKSALLTIQLQDTRAQLDSATEELATANKRIEDLRTLSQANESSLRELTETYDEYKAEQEKISAERTQQIKSLEEDISQTRAELSNCKNDLEAAQKSLESSTGRLNEQLTQAESRVKQLEDSVDEKEKLLGALREDLKRQSNTAQEIQEQYEREIVAHAKDIESTLLAREKLRESQSRASALSAQLSASKQINEKLVAEANTAKEQAEKDSQGTRRRVDELQRQNALLLAHLESIGHQLPDSGAVQSSSKSPSSEDGVVNTALNHETQSAQRGQGDESPSTVPSRPKDSDNTKLADQEGGLREVIVYLRRERDLASAQLELAQQESQRWRQQASHTQRALDEVRSELLQYAPTAASTESSSQNNEASPTSENEIIPAGEGPITLTSTQRQICRQKIEQAMLLRESNVVLRSDLSSTRNHVQQLEKDLGALRDQVVPNLQNENTTMKAELDAGKAQIKQLELMCDHWRQRHEKILARYDMIEPEEFESLKKENAELKQQIAEATQKQKLLSEQIAKAQELQSETSQLNSRIEQQKTELGNMIALVGEKDNTIVSLRAQLGSRQSETEAAIKASEENKSKFEKLHNTFRKLREQTTEGFKARAEKIKQQEESIRTLTNTVKDLETQLEAAHDSAEKATNTVTTEAAAKESNGDLKDQVIQITEERDQLQLKYQVLTQEHEKLTEELKKAQEELKKAQEELEAERTKPQSNVGSENESDGELRSKLAESEARVKDLDSQLEKIKAKALKFVRDNKTLISKVSELEKTISELREKPDNTPNGTGDEKVGELQRQLEETRKQLAESESKIESALAAAKKQADLRSKLQISKANKKASDLEKQVGELQTKIEKLEGASKEESNSEAKNDKEATDDAAQKTVATPDATSLKRPNEEESGPVKKQHID